MLFSLASRAGVINQRITENRPAFFAPPWACVSLSIALSQPAINIESDSERIDSLIRILCRSHWLLARNQQLECVPERRLLQSDGDSRTILQLALEACQSRDEFPDNRSRPEHPHARAEA